MSRFDKQYVNETWTVERTKSGRKIATGMDGGRLCKVWMSDLKDESGFFPIMSRYLVPVPQPIVEDGVLKETKTLWVTRNQARAIYKATGRDMKQGGIEDVLHVLAKVFDKLEEKVLQKVGPNAILAQVMELLMEKAMDKVSNPDFIVEKLDQLFD